MRRLTAATIIAILLMTGLTAPATALAVFPDALNNPNGSAALLLQTLGVLTGYPDGTLRPDVGINRAEFAVTIARLLRAAGHDRSAGGSPFTDLTGAYQWAADDIALVASRGLMQGDPGGAFRPAALVTGGEVAAVLVRLLGHEASALASSAPWPQNYVDMAEALGIWSPGFPSAYAASRGMIAACLSRAIRVPLATPPTAANGATLLDAMQVRFAEATARTVKVQSTGDTVITFADGTIGGTDGIPDQVPLTRNTVIWGAETAADLSGQQVTVYLAGDGQAIHVEPLITGTVTRLTATAGGIAIWLDSGFSTVLDSGLPVLLNHRKASVDVLTSGASIRLAMDVTGERIVSIHAFAPITGEISRQSERSYLVDTAPASLIPVNAGTVFILNGAIVDQRGLDLALADAGVVTASVAWAGTSGFAARIEVMVSETAHSDRTVYQSDLRFIHGTTLRCITLVGDAAEYPIAATAARFRDGSPTDTPPRRGDKVSFTTDAAGDIRTLWIETDNQSPELLSQAPPDTVGEIRLVFDEPLDPAKVSFSIDGAIYGTVGANLNTYSLVREPATDRTIVVLRPQRRLSERTHTVAYDVTDYAGNRLAATATIEPDYAPMRQASVEWPATPTGAGGAVEVHVYFHCGDDDLIDDTSAKDLRNWTFTDANPANGITRIAAVTHAGYYVTLVLSGPVDLGSQLHGNIRDNAGNPVVVDAVCVK